MEPEPFELSWSIYCGPGFSCLASNIVNFVFVAILDANFNILAFEVSKGFFSCRSPLTSQFEI